MMKFFIYIVVLLTVVRAFDVPTVTLRNGVEMPMIAAGVWEYNSSEAESSVSAAFSVGFNMVDTALDYHNQDGTYYIFSPLDDVYNNTKYQASELPSRNSDARTYSSRRKFLGAEQEKESNFWIMVPQHVMRWRRT